MAFSDLSAHPEFNFIREQHEVIYQEMKQSPLWIKWESDAIDQDGNCLFLSGDWTVCPIYFGNYRPQEYVRVQDCFKNRMTRFCETLPDKFPQTTQLLKKIPSVNYAAFTKLKPHSDLAPHHHQNPHSLIMHLGIQIPSAKTCGIKVADEEHIWNQAGEMIIFDDNLEHSAWNRSDEERIVFYLDFIRPT